MLRELREELSSLAETNVVELARAYGPTVLDFLKAVLNGEHMKLRLGKGKPIALKDRLIAADLLRKFAALPSNVQLELGIREKLVYIGDQVSDVNPADKGDTPPILRPEVAAEPDTGGRTPGGSERDNVGRGRRRKSVR